MGPGAVCRDLDDRVEAVAIETAVAEDDVPDTVLDQRREDVRGLLGAEGGGREHGEPRGREERPGNAHQLLLVD